MKFPITRSGRFGVFLLMGALCVACGDGGSGGPSPEADSPPVVAAFELPGDGELAGWSRVTEPDHFVVDNLWEYINGQADFFIDYGFVQVDTAEYQNDQESISVVLEVYLMGRPEEAFGIFAAERTPDDRPAAIGNGAYLGPNVLGFWLGERYVKLTSFDDGPAVESLLVAFAEEFSSRVPGDRGEVAALDLFPVEGRVVSSERFIPKNFLGQKYLTDAYRADYTVEGQMVQLFIVETASSEEAESDFGLLEEFYSQRDDGNVSQETAADVTMLVVDGPSKIVVFHVDQRLGGAIGKDLDSSRAAALALIDSIKP